MLFAFLRDHVIFGRIQAAFYLTTKNICKKNNNRLHTSAREIFTAVLVSTTPGILTTSSKTFNTTVPAIEITVHFVGLISTYSIENI